MLGVILRLAIQSETGKAPYSLGLVGAMWANTLGCFLYGLVARTYFAENTPAACGAASAVIRSRRPSSQGTPA